jgi:gamma-aminobutyric acid type B receptor
MLPSDSYLVPSIVAICEKYNWRHIGIIQQEENAFVETIKNLKEIFNEVNITYSFIQFSTESGPLSLENLFDNKSRIFFLAMYSGYARTVICEVKRIFTLRSRVYC